MCPNRQKLGRDIVQLFSDRFPPFLSGFRERSLLASAALVFVFHWIRTLIRNKRRIFSVEKSVSSCGLYLWWVSRFMSWLVPFPFEIVANRIVIWIVIKVLKPEVSYV